MPADDLILNVKQIAGYPPLGVVPPNFTVVLQDGLGGPYYSASAAALVGTGIAEAGPLMVGTGPAPGDAYGGQIFTDNLVVALGATHNWNCYFSLTTDDFVNIDGGVTASFGFSTSGEYIWNAGPAGSAGAEAGQSAVMTLNSQGYLVVADQVRLNRDPAALLEAATAQWVGAQIAPLNGRIDQVYLALNAFRLSSVTSFNGRLGAVVLGTGDILNAGGAPIVSPLFQGSPCAPTPLQGSNSNRIATTAFVQQLFAGGVGAFAPIDSPAFTGDPTAPTPASGDSSTALATTAFVQDAIGGLDGQYAPIASPVFTGVPQGPTAAPGTSTSQLATTQFVADSFAPLNSPIFSGYVSAPTPPAGTATAQVATTAFVMNAVTEAVTGVVSFNTRTGAVTLTLADITEAGGAATASPAFSGAPTAPTASLGTNNNQIATTAFVMNELGGATVGVMSFNGRGGAVSLLTTDIIGAGGAPLASPAFTGAPTSPTPATGDNSNAIATTAFVESAIANSATGVESFNGRTGTVTLNVNDISAAGGAVLNSPAFVGTPTAPTAPTGTNNTQIATTAYVNAALGAIGGVTTFNGRSGPVTLTLADVTAVLPPASTNPLMNGAANPGVAVTWSRSDHVHPSDTTRLALAGGTMTGGLTVPQIVVSNGQIVIQRGAATNPVLWFNDGTTNRTGLYFNVASGMTTLLDQYSGVNIQMGPSNIMTLNASSVVAAGAMTVSSTLAVAGAATFSAAITIAGSMSLSNSGGYLASSAGFMAPLLRFSSGNGLLNPGGISVVGDAAQLAFAASGSSPTGVAWQGTNAANSVAYFVWVSAISDARIKENVSNSTVDALALICALPVRQFDFNKQAIDALRPATGAPRMGVSSYHVDIGLVAQEVGAVIPDMDVVAMQPEGHDPSFPTDLHNVILENAIPYLIRAIQQLAARVATLEGATA